MSTTAQRLDRLIREVERTGTDLMHFVETYSANAANAQGYHRERRRELFGAAREYGAAVRRLARLRV